MREVRTPPHLINERYADRYFDVVDALEEAEHIHFRHNRLLERLAANDGRLVIGETGFGAGRIVVALMDFLRRHGVENVAIDYYSVELHPLSVDRICTILAHFQDRADEEIAALVEAYRSLDIQRPGWHSMRLQRPFGVIGLRLWIGEALEMVEALDTACDLWFLDGHSPRKNPSMWRPELLAAIGERTKLGGACSTFTVASAVQRSLAAAGFSVRKLPGHGVKKEVLQGLRSSREPSPLSP